MNEITENQYDWTNKQKFNNHGWMHAQYMMNSNN